MNSRAECCSLIFAISGCTAPICTPNETNLISFFIYWEYFPIFILDKTFFLILRKRYAAHALIGDQRDGGTVSHNKIALLPRKYTNLACGKKYGSESVAHRNGNLLSISTGFLKRCH
jgi:hypothetical protein